MISTAERRKTLFSSREVESASAKGVGPHSIREVRASQSGAFIEGKSYVTLQVRTESGLIGYGECHSLSDSELKATTATVKGRTASAYEVLGSLVPANARAAVDMALLDILGKTTQAPVYRLVGGPTRNKARGIVRLVGSSDGELQDDLRKQWAAGFRAFLVPIPASEARNQGSAFIHAGVVRLQAMRAAVPDADFALEGGNLLTPGDAASLAAALEYMHPLWFDSPCPVSNLATIRKIADETVMPLGFGRNVSNSGTFQDLLREGLVDLVRPDLLTYGISGIRRIAAMAETYYVAVSPWHEGGPLATAAALHAAASIPNFFVAQLPNWGGGSAAPRDGFFELPKGPGLGVEVDDKEFERNRLG